MDWSRDRAEDAVEDLARYVEERLLAARSTLPLLGRLSSLRKDRALAAMGDAIWRARDEILAANGQDMALARQAGMDAARLDRLRLDAGRIQAMVAGLEEVAAIEDPIGEQIESIQRPNGLRIAKVRVPLGVVAMIYESRPNVTVDAGAIAFKAGSAVVLRGSREALHSNRALVTAMHQGLGAAGVPSEAIQLLDRGGRETVGHLITARGLVDLVIPRGGAGLIQYVAEHARVPIIETGVGNCHVYVDREADLAKAQAIVLNAKCQRPSVCNAMETLLVHRDVAEAFLPKLGMALAAAGVELRACPLALPLLEATAARPGACARAATEEDWATEYLAPVLAVRVVGGLEAAMQHIARYGTRHSESIVTEDRRAARRFLEEVDAAVVYHNASTRFTDGHEFGFGVEIGISTQVLHARGPMGLRELTSYKYMVEGEGQVRDGPRPKPASQAVPH